MLFAVWQHGTDAGFVLDLRDEIDYRVHTALWNYGAATFKGWFFNQAAAESYAASL